MNFVTAFAFSSLLAMSVAEARQRCLPANSCKSKRQCYNASANKWTCVSVAKPLPKRASPRYEEPDWRRGPNPLDPREDGTTDRFGRQLKRDPFGRYEDEHGFPQEKIYDEYGREYTQCDGIGSYCDSNGFRYHP